MAKLLTGTRIYGTGTVDTQLFVSGTNSATSTTTGALQVVGGVGVGGNLHVGGIIYGAILGTATTATNSDNVKTVLSTSTSVFFPVFVDSNNATAGYEAVYSSSTFTIIPSSGNVGIGVATPTEKLHVAGNYLLLKNTADTAAGAVFDSGSTLGQNTQILLRDRGSDKWAVRKNSANNFDIYGSAVGAAALTIFSLTNFIGIGATVIEDVLHVRRDSTATSTGIVIQNRSASGLPEAGIKFITGSFDLADTRYAEISSTGTSSPSLIFKTANGATPIERMRITALGGISFGASGTAYGVSGQILQSNGNAAPTWISTGSLAAANATTATHLSGGTAGQVPYQTAPGVTSFYGPGTAGNVLVSNGTSAPSYNNTLTLAGTTAATSTTTGTLVVVGGVGIGNNLFVSNNINAVNGQFVSTRANNATTDAGQILLNGATGNRIDFNQNGVAAPAFTTRSAGTKLVLYSNLSGSAVDYAIGIESSSLWSSVPNTGSFFKWYGGTTLAATLTGAGNLTLVGDLAVNGGDITTTQATFNLINTTATTVNFAGSATTLTMGASGSGTTNVRNNLTVSGNLTVQGTTTIVDSTVTNIADPIITLGGGTGNSAPTADDNKDRGVAFKYVNNAGTTSTGFFGYDDSTGYLTYVPTATITNEVVSGTKGAMDVNLAGGTAMSIHYQSAADTTAFLAAGSSGYLLQTNGTGSAPSWVSASGVSAGSATYADNIRTIAQTASAVYYPAFVDSNNATNAYESVYTTSSFTINPATGNITAPSFSIQTNTTPATFIKDDNLTSWMYSGKSFSVAGQESGPTGIFFKPDGLVMYVTGSTGDDVNQYSLSVAWNVSTAAFVQVSAGIGDTAPTGVFFKPDGLAMYIMASTLDTVREFSLSVAWDVSTITFVREFSVAGQETSPQDLWFKPDGTKMYIVGSSNDRVYEYNLSTAWNVSTAVFLQFFLVSGQDTTPVAVVFNPDGTKMYMLGASGLDINRYSLSTPWDISTAVFFNNFYVGFQEASVQSLFINFASDTAYIVGSGNDSVYQYTTLTDGIELTSSAGLFIDGSLYTNRTLVVTSGTRIDGTLSVSMATTLASSLTVSSTANLDGAVGMGTTTGAINIGTSQSTGATIIGGTAQTGGLTLGRSTGAQTVDIAVGATTNGTIKLINVGANGVSGSITNINVGSTVTGALGTLTINSTQTVITSTTNASSTATGALQVRGGVGIGGNLWVGGTINGTATTSSNANTVVTLAQTANASYFPTFVDSNNASAASELVYTTSSFSINPSNGNIQIGMTGQDYQPSSGGNHTLRLNAANTSSIGFHDSGSTIASIKFSGAYGFEIGAYDGTYGPHNTILHGSVGIGTQSPGAKLEVYVSRTASTNAVALLLNDNVTGAQTNGVYKAIRSQSNGGSSVSEIRFVETDGTNNNTAIAFATAPTAGGLTERMRVDPDGNVGIGIVATERFHVFGTAYGAATQGPRINLQYSGTSGGAESLLQFLDFRGVVNASMGSNLLDDGVGTAAAAMVFKTATAGTLTERLRITRNGGISFGASGTAYGTSGQVLQSNGDAAPTWIALSGSTVGTSTQVTTVARTTNASHFLTFVDSNNASATAEPVYTTSSFVINPQSGNVGIGTSSPSVKLHIRNDSATVYSPSTAAFNSLLYLVNGTSGASTNALMVFATESNGEWYIGGVQNAGNTAADFIWASRTPAGRAERMRITSDGNVGINSIAPASKLTVEGSGTANESVARFNNQGDYASRIWLRQSSRSAYLSVSGSTGDTLATGSLPYGLLIGLSGNPSPVQFYNGTSGAVKMTIDTAGNVGIGTTSPTNKFEVAGSAGQLFSVSDSFTGTIFSANDVSGIPSIEVIDTGLVKFAQYGGQVAINTGTVASSTASLSVYGMIQTMGTLGEIRASSEITAYFSSDRRLKENIKLIENPITIIDQIRGVTFDWTDEHMARRGGEDGYFVRKHDIGVIAQEVQAVLPELVGTREDGYLAVKYEKMVALLIEAIKAQQKTIDSLVKDLDNVKEFINNFKNGI